MLFSGVVILPALYRTYLDNDNDNNNNNNKLSFRNAQITETVTKAREATRGEQSGTERF